MDQNPTKRPRIKTPVPRKTKVDSPKEFSLVDFLKKHKVDCKASPNMEPCKKHPRTIRVDVDLASPPRWIRTPTLADEFCLYDPLTRKHEVHVTVFIPQNKALCSIPATLAWEFFPDLMSTYKYAEHHELHTHEPTLFTELDNALKYADPDTKPPAQQNAKLLSKSQDTNSNVLILDGGSDTCRIGGTEWVIDELTDRTVTIAGYHATVSHEKVKIGSAITAVDLPNEKTVLIKVNEATLLGEHGNSLLSMYQAQKYGTIIHTTPNVKVGPLI